MTLRQPPRFAGRLLKRLVPAQDHDALLGDLQEERQRGRSTVWYLLQIVAAVIVGSWKDVRTHKLLTIRAIVVGVVLLFFTAEMMSQLQDLLTGGGFLLGTTWIGLPWYWHWPYAPSLERVMFGVWIAGALLRGWLIVRLDRGHGVAMVLAFSCVMFAIRMESHLRLVFLMGHQPNIRDLSYALVIGQVWETLVMILGGSLATRRPEVA